MSQCKELERNMEDTEITLNGTDWSNLYIIDYAGGCGGEKVGDLMNVAISPKDAKAWFGAMPPDLSVIARAKGVDYLYTYLRTYYQDDTKITGWNNMAYPAVAMPNV